MKLMKFFLFQIQNRILGIFSILARYFLGSEGFAIPSLLLIFLGLICCFTLLYHYLSKRKKGAATLLYVLIDIGDKILRFKLFTLIGAAAASILGVLPEPTSSFFEGVSEEFLGYDREPEVNQPQRLPLPGPSRPSASTENSFGIQVISEPWDVTPNVGLESSMRNRILRMENANSIFLLDKESGQYWSEIKAELTACSSQREYNQKLEFENRDLQIREMKTECYSLVREIVFNQPALMANSPYETPETAIQQFCDDTRADLEAEDQHRLGFHSGDTDRAELQIYKKVARDICQNGPQSFYFKKILGHFDKNG